MCLCTTVLMSQERKYELEDESVYFPPTKPAPVVEEKPFAITPYTWGLRVGTGYTVSLLNFNFDEEGEINGMTADVLREDADNGFTWPNWGVNIEAKIGMGDPFENFALGLAVDYRLISVRNLEFAAQSMAGSIVGSQEDVCDFHVLSVIAFLEYRYPIPVGTHWISPYIRFGVGMNINMNDNRDLIEADSVNLAMMGALGVEYHVSPEISLFFEPRWHYNRADVDFTPINGKFPGEVTLSNVTFMIGVNFYFGLGQSL